MEYRQTKQKQAIYEAVRGKDKYMSAADVYEIVRKDYPNISLKTVYRNLNTLCDMKLIAKIVDDKQTYYDGNPLPHYHLHCQKCDRYYDVDIPYNHSFDDKVAGMMGADVNRHTVVFEGVCKACKKEGE